MRISDWSSDVCSSDLPDKAGVFNNAAQVWNHDFYWDSLRPNGGGKPTGKVADLIKDSFGDYDKFKADFAAACVGQRSEEHTSELQSLMRISYAVLCLKKKSR